MRITLTRRSLISATFTSTFLPSTFRTFPNLSHFIKRTLNLETLSLFMASDNVSTLAGDDEEYGFLRTEMYQSDLAGTVDAYDRHVFLCYKNPEAWASRVENSESDPLPKLFASALKARKNDITVKVSVKLCIGLSVWVFLCYFICYPIGLGIGTLELTGFVSGRRS